MPLDFKETFRALTGMTKPNEGPFPWQVALYDDYFSKGKIPASCNLPTGLGKTSVIAVWLIALANGAQVPRRLVYVVNRRTVVDQTTDEVKKYRDNSAALGLTQPLAISTLRGQFADNREWSADPSRPAVICGTVDMIGSRLLFSGYGCGFKTRPLHAGFLGQDALIVHDEAHLEPAFQELLLAIEKEQRDGRTPDFCPLRVMELTATSRASGETFPTDEVKKENEAHPVVHKRITATKKLKVLPVEKSIPDDIVKCAKALTEGERPKDRAILIFARSVKDVADIIKKLPKDQTQQLTGTLRGLERDRMANPRREDGCPIFARFLPPPKENAPEHERWKVKPQEGTVYLVCTSAGEVGVNISADHLVCDLSTFESMAQRFGRVNRFGRRDDTEIHVYCPNELKKDDALYTPLNLTRGLLELLEGNASPQALGELRERAIREGTETSACGPHVQALRDYVNAHQGEDPRLGGYAPQPIILPTSDILFDAWALTSASRPLVKQELPGRPDVEPYLHGVEDDKKRETQVAWRAEVTLFEKSAVTTKQIGELFDDFPLKPHETLRDATYRVQDELAELAKAHGDAPVWVIDLDDTVHVLTLADLAKEGKKGYEVNLSARTVVLPPKVGGLTDTGTLDGKAKHDPERPYDVAGRSLPASGVPLVRLLATRTDDELSYAPVAPVLDLPAGFSFDLDGENERLRLRRVFPAPFPPMRVALRFDLSTDEDATDGKAQYLVLKPEVRKDMKYEAAWPSLAGHLEGVKSFAEAICKPLELPADVSKAITLAAGWHDLGKDRAVWQRGAGNKPVDAAVAKPLHGRAPENLNHFRHELASLVDVSFEAEHAKTLAAESPACRELALHTIATHHGRGRPHFPANEVTDPDRPAVAAEGIAAATPRRFAKLQREYGRWGLAYLESLLRAADALDSQRLEATPIGTRELGSWPRPKPDGVVWSVPTAPPTPAFSVNVDVTNPGQFFACCGLLELADRLWPGAEGWFADGQFHVTCQGALMELLEAVRTIKIDTTTAAENDEADDDEDSGFTALEIISPIRLRLDWWAEKALKPWAGTMREGNIFPAVCAAIDPKNPDPLNQREIVYDPVTPSTSGKRAPKRKKREPFYFDAHRGANALAIDIGYMPDAHGMETVAAPAVEALCLIGLQRCRPMSAGRPRMFDYFTWSMPSCVAVLPVVMNGLIPDPHPQQFRFENAFRTGQKKHKAFNPASLISTGGSDADAT